MGRAKTNWIKGAIGQKGGLHKSLGVPMGQRIPKAMIRKAAQAGGKKGRQARLAMTLSRLRKK